MLNRTFGCVRVVWNRTLASRRARWQAERIRHMVSLQVTVPL